ncbi:MAG: hypothetical protein IMX02_07365 [Limnochordaceae bacterium]|nr:hypothetical protein [Limnochordaceae bacterium]
MPAGRLFAWQWGAGPDLVVLPGVEEALLSRAALGWVMGRWWAPFARRYGMRVTALAARESVPPEFTTQQMGQDAAAALEALGMRPVAIVGVGAGGAVAEWAAVEVALRGSAAPALILLSVPAGLRTTGAQAGFYDHLVRLLRGTSPEQAFDHLCGLYLDADLGRRHRLDGEAAAPVGPQRRRAAGG